MALSLKKDSALGKLVSTAGKVASAVSSASKTTGSANQSTGSGSTESTPKTTGTGSAGVSSGGSSSGGGAVVASGGDTSTPSGGYTQTYTGGNAELDAKLAEYSNAYMDARARGDAAGMREANDAANQLRNQYGYAAELANEDISKVAAAGKVPEAAANPGAVSTAPENFQGSATGVQVNTEDQEKIRQEMNANSIAWHTADEATKKYLEARNQYLASILNAGGGNVSFDPVSGTWGGSAGGQTPATVIPGTATSAQKQNTGDLQNLLDEWRKAALEQNQGKIDYNVEKAVQELERALADSEDQFKEQAEQVARDEMQSRDNSALYSEMRGDKGGIGKEQYSSIMNTAAQNRLTVQQAQTKLATDTQRQIADLRAQGEFEKADAALEIAQTYLSQLISLEQWAAEYNLSVDQFNESVRQWEAEFQQSMNQFNANQELAWAELTGKYAGGTTLQAQKLVTDQLISSGQNLLAYGIMPSDEQLEAMGMTKEQASQMVAAIQLERAAEAEANAAKKGSGVGSGAGSDGGNDQGGEDLKSLAPEEIYRYLFDAGYTNKDSAGVKAYLLSQGLSATLAAAYAEAYTSTYYKRLKNTPKPRADYGTKYTSAVATARLMQADGKSFEAIDDYLSRFTQTELTDAGLDSIASILNFGGYSGNGTTTPNHRFVETTREGVISG